MVTQNTTNGDSVMIAKLFIVIGIVLATSLVPTPADNSGFYFYDNQEGITGAWMFCPAPLTAADCHVPTGV